MIHSNNLNFQRQKFVLTARPSTNTMVDVADYICVIYFKSMLVLFDDARNLFKILYVVYYTIPKLHFKIFFYSPFSVWCCNTIYDIRIANASMAAPAPCFLEWLLSRFDL